MGVTKADFSGYATKVGLKCSDGRTIMPDAFKDMDGKTVPLVWQHTHDEPSNILGHAVFEARDDGLYSYGFFNETPAGLTAKALVHHKDITALSIWANKLLERSGQVFHGIVRELSLVLSGANPGAFIDNVNLEHGDGTTSRLDDEVVISIGEQELDFELEHADSTDSSGPTVQDIYDGMSPEEKAVVHYMVGVALEGQGDSASHSDLDDADEDNDEADDEDNLAHQEGTNVTRNVFDQIAGASTQERQHLTRDQIKTIIADGKRLGSLKEAFLAHVDDYGIQNIDYLFPDAKTIADSPEFVSRRMEWVTTVINGSKHTPFSRIKSISADITLDTARAKGYVKTTMKKEEFFALSKRVTTPTTIYKKQKLDRDDIIDITDLDVVAWLKAEMRVMLDEEIARAGLLGDGREVDDEDKIPEANIRPIAYDDDFYAHQVTIPANTVGDSLVEAIVRARPFYRGAGNPTMFCTEDFLTDLLLIKDAVQRRIYPTATDLAAALRVSNIVTVPVMEDLTTDGGDLLCILVNMSDYTFGSDQGGQVSMFDDFDIDYNQYKYLIEGRMSGALTKYKTALVFSRGAGTLVAAVTAPTFVTSTGVATLPAVTGVVWKMDGVTKSSGAQTAIAAGATTVVTAEPASGYYFHHNILTDWTFTRDA